MTDPDRSTLPSTYPDHWDNLLWALTTDDISETPSLPWLPSERRAELGDFFAAPATRASLENILRTFVESTSSRRLGVYFENLWTFAFRYHPQYQLIARNLPLRVAGKTLGELDYVVRYLPDDVTEHWEVAVKFYLQVADAWVGPGLKDRLDIKLARTRDHQLPIIHQPEVEPLLRDQGIEIQRQWTLMPGRRFRSLDNVTADKDFWWSDWPGFLQAFADKPWHWLQLPKQCWLAPCIPTHDTAPLTLTDATDAITEKLKARGPLCVAAVDKHREVTRGFIVPDDWASRAQLAIP
ncbi:DUF1853 family protein [Microbulbifer sp. MCCC 1A16149]|uniref:DUF1853 family protein n=1 Tax=Microbulbifer sp. MCCC 1A16149 TaxID=3411322 RepID=UPI003D0FCDD1